MKNYFFLLLLVFFLGFISKELLNTEELVINSLAEQLTTKQIEKTLDFQQKWEWIAYLLLPLLLIIKVSIIALILDVGCFLFGEEIKYKKLFNIVTKAEFVFLGVIILKTLKFSSAWFYFFQTNYNI